MSFFLAFIGISVLGTWGLASIGIMAGGIFLLVSPGDQPTPSDPVLGGIVLLVFGLVSMGLMFVTVMPLLGIDPPFPIPAKSIVPESRLTRWVKAGQIRDLPDGTPKEVRLLSKRVVLVRQGNVVHALNGLCSHARLGIGGLPITPIKPYPVTDGCVICPFHGARFEVESGKVVRQPFDSRWNNDHPFLGRMQAKLFGLLSKIPAPPGMPKPSMRAEDLQTFPTRIENGEVMVALPQ